MKPVDRFAAPFTRNDGGIEEKEGRYTIDTKNDRQRALFASVHAVAFSRFR